MDANSLTQAAPDGGEAAYLRAVARAGDRKALVVAQPIYSANGIKLLDTGARIDSRIFERLFHHSLREPIDQCVSAAEAIGGQEMVARAREIVVQCGLLAHFAATLGGREERLWAVLASCSFPPAIQTRLTVVRETRTDLFDHALRATFIALFVGMQSAFSDRDLEILVYAALLHDVGMMHIDPAQMIQGKPLDAGARRTLLTHPLTAEMIVRREPALSPMVAAAVAQHHERLDGTGYPRGLKDEGICKFARILMLVEIVAAVIEGGRDDLDLQISMILRLNRGSFDPDFSAVLLQSLPQVALPRNAAKFNREEYERVMSLFDYWVLLSGDAVLAPDSADAALDRRIARLRKWLAETGIGSGRASAAVAAGEEQASVGVELQAIARELLWHLRQVAMDITQRWPDLAKAAGADAPRASKWAAAAMAGSWDDRAPGAADDAAMPA